MPGVERPIDSAVSRSLTLSRPGKANLRAGQARSTPTNGAWSRTEIGRCNRVRIGPRRAVGDPAKSSRGGCQGESVPTHQMVRRDRAMAIGLDGALGPAPDRQGRCWWSELARGGDALIPFVEPGQCVGVGELLFIRSRGSAPTFPLDTESCAALPSRHSCGSAPTDNQPMTIGCSARCCRRPFGRRL
jgi:hypothetical protein